MPQTFHEGETLYWLPYPFCFRLRLETYCQNKLYDNGGNRHQREPLPSHLVFGLYKQNQGALQKERKGKAPLLLCRSIPSVFLQLASILSVGLVKKMLGQDLNNLFCLLKCRPLLFQDQGKRGPIEDKEPWQVGC